MTTTKTQPTSNHRGPTDTEEPRTGSRMWTSRLIGALFLAGFIIYGTGSLLVESVVDGPDFLASVDPLMPWHMTAFHPDYRVHIPKR